MHEARDKADKLETTRHPTGRTDETPMHWMFKPLRRYAEFHGRSTRTEFWMFALFQFLLMSALFVVGAVGACVGDKDIIDVDRMQWLAEFLGILALAFLIPNLAVSVRRLHDQNLTGWILLVGLVPYLGGLIVLMTMCVPGTRGRNRFGPDPRDRSARAPDLGRVFE